MYSATPEKDKYQLSVSETIECVSKRHHRHRINVFKLYPLKFNDVPPDECTAEEGKFDIVNVLERKLTQKNIYDKNLHCTCKDSCLQSNEVVN
jgi:hypothetical protein